MNKKELLEKIEKREASKRKIKWIYLIMAIFGLVASFYAYYKKIDLLFSKEVKEVDQGFVLLYDLTSLLILSGAAILVINCYNFVDCIKSSPDTDAIIALLKEEKDVD